MYYRATYPNREEAGAAPVLRTRQSVRQLHLPPIASQLSTFTALPAVNDEDEGILYVDKLQVRAVRPPLILCGQSA